jgi:hypothetical protein
MVSFDTRHNTTLVENHFLQRDIRSGLDARSMPNDRKSALHRWEERGFRLRRQLGMLAI